MRDAAVAQALLEGVPRRAKTQLAALCYDAAAISAFTEQWPADVVRAYYHLADRGIPIDVSVSSVVLRWGAKTPDVARDERC